MRDIFINGRGRSFRQGGPSWPFLFVAIFVFAVVAIIAYVMFRDLSGPEITMEPMTTRIKPDQDITLTLKDRQSEIKSVAAVVRYSGDSIPVFEHVFTEEKNIQRLTFSLKNTAIKDGTFNLEIVARDSSFAGLGRGNSTTLTHEYLLDTQPPQVTILTPPATLRRGGVAVFVYSLNEKVSRTGIRAADIFFPAFELEKDKYCCFIAFPITEHAARIKAKIVATDLAGNVVEKVVPIQLQDRQFNTDRLMISDRFLQQKALDFEVLAPGEGLTPLQRYLYINGETRKKNEAVLRELALKTTSSMLWKGEFIKLPGSALRARYGDSRTYFYKDQPVDQQVHMGVDFASVRRADVPAANDGIVVFSGPLGIFGNLVVIDHGLGLMSLYSHMSQIFVTVDEKVSKGQVIASTGTTGLAGGDHLHFGMLLNGIQVQPLDWLDKNWVFKAINNRIATALSR